MEGAEENIDVSAFRDRPIHEAVAPIIWLHGTWRTESGRGCFAEHAPFVYGEELQFASVGMPGLSYTAFSWSPEKKMPLHQESGFLRIQTGTNNLAFLVAQNLGLSGIEEGEVSDHTITLTSKALSHMSFFRGNPVTSTKRIFQLKSDQELEQTFYFETAESPMAEHLRAIYRKVD